jgi:dihydroorotate dehydrogenase (NAD+) catalytic subunit
VLIVTAPTLNINLSGLELRNPLILASGILGVTAETMARVSAAGAGAIVTKSIGLEPREGHRNPTLIELPHGLLNAMGLPNPGIEEFCSELPKLLETGTPVIGSIFGKDAGEYAKLGAKMEEAGVSALELNLSCPHAKGLGLELGSDPEMVKNITSAVTSEVNIPVFAKLTPHTPNLVELGEAAVAGGAKGLVAVNTIKAMKIDTATGTPVLGNIIGGYSGPALKPIGVRAVYELSAAELGIPVIGVGGVMTGEDVVEYLMAGASAVQLGSAVFYDGMNAFDKIHRELRSFMESNNYSNINDIIGLALRK